MNLLTAYPNLAGTRLGDRLGDQPSDIANRVPSLAALLTAWTQSIEDEFINCRAGDGVTVDLEGLEWLLNPASSSEETLTEAEADRRFKHLKRELRKAYEGRIGGDALSVLKSPRAMRRAGRTTPTAGVAGPQLGALLRAAADFFPAARVIEEPRVAVTRGQTVDRDTQAAALIETLDSARESVQESELFVLLREFAQKAKAAGILETDDPGELLVALWREPDIRQRAIEVMQVEELSVLSSAVEEATRRSFKREVFGDGPATLQDFNKWLEHESEDQSRNGVSDTRILLVAKLLQHFLREKNWMLLVRNSKTRRLEAANVTTARTHGKLRFIFRAMGTTDEYVATPPSLPAGMQVAKKAAPSPRIDP